MIFESGSHVRARWIFLFFICFQIQGQVRYSVKIGGLYSVNQRAPFWIKSNQFGTVPDTSNTLFFEHAVQWSHKGLEWGAQMNVWSGHQARVLLPEIYGSYNVGGFRFLVGRKKQYHGWGDSTLSSGSMTWSGNALPIPEVQVSIPEYRRIWPKVLAIKGHYSHGWFGDQHFVKQYYLHQKSLYLRWGEGKVRFHTGIMHHAQWGGKPKYDPGPEGWLAHGQRFASGGKVYREVVFPFTNPPRDSAKVASFDFENRYGNHLGQLDWGLEGNIGSSVWKVYRQLPFETGQTFSSLGNLDDGVYGISLNRKKGVIRHLVLEFLHTTNQGLYRSGFLRFIGYKGRHYGRNQNYYFSHAQYLDGWSYEGRTLGSPFLLPNPDIRDEKTVDSPNYFANNNNIKAGYVGLKTQLNSVSMITKVSLSRNFGTYHKKIQADQLSLGHNMEIPVSGATIAVEVGIDHGDLIRDNFGIQLSWKKTWQ